MLKRALHVSSQKMPVGTKQSARVTATSDLAALVALAARAGALIMGHYEAGVGSRTKADRSPVTVADEEAEDLILEGLALLHPGVPVVSEEAAANGHFPEIGETFFLVDPLDGTKEFLAHNGEFTVNIALIHARRAVSGIVYAPALTQLYAGADGHAFALNWPHAASSAPDLSEARRIHARTPPDHPVALWSRSHDIHKADEYREMYNFQAVRTLGSSLKFCIIAAGEADLYPRHGPTMEWDTAAGHAVLTASGGSVRKLDGSPFMYAKNADRYRNPSFVARGAE